MINGHGTLFQNKHDLSILGTYKYLFVNHKNKLKCVCYIHTLYQTKYGSVLSRNWRSIIITGWKPRG